MYVNVNNLVKKLIRKSKKKQTMENLLIYNVYSYTNDCINKINVKNLVYIFAIINIKYLLIIYIIYECRFQNKCKKSSFKIVIILDIQILYNNLY